MGLEIFYDLHAPAHWSTGRVEDIVEQVHDFALMLGFAEVDSVLPNNPDAPETLLIKDTSDAALPPSVNSTEGWFFRTWPGEGCETAFVGLCRFPGKGSVVSPIFSAPDFERMEAQGQEIIHRERENVTDGLANESAQEDDSD